jgi:hypothetical protein
LRFAVDPLYNFSQPKLIPGLLFENEKHVPRLQYARTYGVDAD